MIKAVLFDLDGVLVDASKWHFYAFNLALKVFGFQIEANYHDKFLEGLPTQKKLEILSAEFKLPKKLHSTIWNLKQEYTKKCIEEFCTVDRDKIELVQELKNSGYRLAVCSNAIQESVQYMLSASGLKDYFEFYLSNEDVSKPKPDSEIYLLALEKLRLIASEVLIVEDSEHGKKAAHESGCHVFEVGSYEDVCISNFRSLLDHNKSSESVQKIEDAND